MHRQGRWCITSTSHSCRFDRSRSIYICPVDEKDCGHWHLKKIKEIKPDIVDAASPVIGAAVKLEALQLMVGL